MTAASKVRAEALALSEEDRLELAAELFSSVHGRRNPAWEDAWFAECERRMTDLASGKTTSVSWADVDAELAARFGTR